jgi:hypothetical protein
MNYGGDMYKDFYATILLLTDFVGRLYLIKIHQTFHTNRIHTLHLYVQGGSYLC